MLYSLEGYVLLFTVGIVDYCDNDFGVPERWSSGYGWDSAIGVDGF